MRNYKVISADGHLEAATFSLAAFLPKKFAGLAPNLITKADGTDWWVMGEFESKNAGNLYSGARFNEWIPPLACSYRMPDGTKKPGTGDAKSRLQEQDLDGIDAEVLFPPAQGPRFYRKILDKDPLAHIALHQAYNSFLADYCSIAPDRLIGSATVPETSINDAIKEMERARKLGLKSVTLSMWPSGTPHATPQDDRFWAAALDLDMRLSPHKNFGSATLAGGALGADPTGAFVLTGGTPVEGIPQTVAQLIFNGTLDRFPRLRFYFAEANPGYLGYLMNAADEHYLRYKWFHRLNLAKMPSEYYRDHTCFSFTHDRMTMKYRYDIGLDLLMWGSDAPHSFGSFPNTREILMDLFDGVPAEERRQVLVTNVCEFFGLDPDADLTSIY